VHARVTDILVDQRWKHGFFFIVEQVPGMMTFRSTGSGDCSRSDWDDWIDELKQRAPMWRVFPWTLNTSAWLPQNRPRIYTVGLHASLASRRILPPANPANPCSLLDVLHPGLPRTREVGLTAQQLENLVVADRLGLCCCVGSWLNDLVEIGRHPDRTTWILQLQCVFCTGSG